MEGSTVPRVFLSMSWKVRSCVATDVGDALLGGRVLAMNTAQDRIINYCLR